MEETACQIRHRLLFSVHSLFLPLQAKLPMAVVSHLSFAGAQLNQTKKSAALEEGVKVLNFELFDTQ